MYKKTISICSLSIIFNQCSYSEKTNHLTESDIIEFCEKNSNRIKDLNVQNFFIGTLVGTFDGNVEGIINNGIKYLELEDLDIFLKFYDYVDCLSNKSKQHLFSFINKLGRCRREQKNPKYSKDLFNLVEKAKSKDNANAMIDFFVALEIDMCDLDFLKHVVSLNSENLKILTKLLQPKTNNSQSIAIHQESKNIKFNLKKSIIIKLIQSINDLDSIEASRTSIQKGERSFIILNFWSKHVECPINGIERLIAIEDSPTLIKACELLDESGINLDILEGFLSQKIESHSHGFFKNFCFWA